MGDLGLTSRQDSQEGGSDNFTKKQRTTPAPEVTHISNSFPSQNGDVDLLRTELAKRTAALAAEKEAHITVRNSLQIQLEVKEKELREQMSTLGALQTRFEALSREQTALKYRNNELTEAATRMEEKYEKLLSDCTEAREERKKVQGLLSEAQARLEESSIPEVAELQRLRNENQKLSDNKSAAERRATSAQEDRDYAQRVYQDASSSAVQAKERVTQLESQLTQYQSLASGEASRLRTQNNEDEIKQYEAALEKANAELEDLKEQLKKRGDRGRGMNTRAGSTQPRSPRPGNSPTRSRGNSRAPGSGGSRPVSPIRTLLGGRRGRGIIE